MKLINSFGLLELSPHRQRAKHGIAHLQAVLLKRVEKLNRLRTRMKMAAKALLRKKRKLHMGRKRQPCAVRPSRIRSSNVAVR